MRHGWLAAALLAAGCASTEAAPAAEPEAAAWAAVAGPGPEHAFLAAQAGTWDAAGKIWASPGEPPLELPGKARNALILDGRYLVQDYESEFMGHVFRGHGIYGFDRIRGRYVGVWTDSESTIMMATEGTADASGKAVTRSGAVTLPGGTVRRVREVMTLLGPDEMLYEHWSADGAAPERKVIEVRYRRRSP